MATEKGSAGIDGGTPVRTKPMPQGLHGINEGRRRSQRLLKCCGARRSFAFCCLTRTPTSRLEGSTESQ